MIYIFTADDCPKCVALKAEYTQKGIVFEERSAERIKKCEDEADREALIQGSMQNMVLPIVVEFPAKDFPRKG